jgi:hypothetical protein
MSGVTWLLLTLSGLVSPMSVAQRCTLLDAEHLSNWADAERRISMVALKASQPPHRRRHAWRPDVSFSAGLKLDDGDQYRVSDGSEASSLRTSVLSEGGQRTEYEVRFKWFLSTHRLSPQDVTWRRYFNREQLRIHNRLGELINIFGRWVKTLEQRCQIETGAALDSSLFNLEMQLNHLSQGRFYQWLKENK